MSWPVRNSLIALVALAACGAPPPPPVAAPEPIKRDLTARVETDRGVVRMEIDGIERLRASANHASSVTLALREGEHRVVFLGEPSEYGGMGVETELSNGGAPILSLTCAHPCDAARLAQALRDTPPGGCEATEVESATARAESGGGFEIRVALRVAGRCPK